MPRLSKAMKDVISCDKLWEGANNLRSADFRMGQPGVVKRHHSAAFVAECEPGELKHLSNRRKRKQ